jgi:carboxypeptidase family protein
MPHFLRIIAAGVALLVSTEPARADVSGIMGTTVDCDSHRTIPYANVTVKPAGSRFGARTLTSDERGRFTVLGLQPGRYYVVVDGDSAGRGYWGPHVVSIESNDLQHLQISATRKLDARCPPYFIPHQPGTTDQTMLGA